MALHDEYIKLSELAEKWSKTSASIVGMLVANRMIACFWYEGCFISAEDNAIGLDSDCYKGWAVADGRELEPLVTQKNVRLKYFARMVYPLPLPSYFCHEFVAPAKAHLSGSSRRCDFEVTIDDLVIPVREVERMEHEYSELTGEQPRQPVGEKTKNKESKPNPRMVRTDLHIIGGLLEILLGNDPLKRDLPFKSKAALINALTVNLDGFAGISERTLDARFKEAQNAISERE